MNANVKCVDYKLYPENTCNRSDRKWVSAAVPKRSTDPIKRYALSRYVPRDILKYVLCIKSKTTESFHIEW